MLTLTLHPVTPVDPACPLKPAEPTFPGCEAFKVLRKTGRAVRRSLTLKTPEGNIQTVVAPLWLQQGETVRRRGQQLSTPGPAQVLTSLINSFQTRLVCQVDTLVPELTQVGFLPNLQLRTQLAGSRDKTSLLRMRSVHAEQADAVGQGHKQEDGGTDMDARRFDRVSSESSARVRGSL